MTPGIGPVPACGNQSLVPRNPNQDCVIAIPKAAAVVTQKELNLPRSAAARAGTMSSVTVNGSMKLLTEAARMPKAPVKTVDRTQFVPASRSGENPMSIAPFSFSAAARVASPKRMKRNTAHSAPVTARTMIGEARSSLGITSRPGNLTGRLRGWVGSPAPAR